MAKTKTRENAEKQALIIIFIALFTKKFASSSPCGRCCCYDKSQGSFLLCYFSLLVVPIIPRLEIWTCFFIFKIGAE